jgi:fibronectin type 3 domain-containing protein
MINRSQRFVALCLVLVLSGTGACGRKTQPLVPDSPRPEAVRDIKVLTRDVIAYLSWPLPTRNVEGRDLGPSDIRGFRIYRAEIGQDQKKVRYRQIAEINLADLPPAAMRNGTVFWNDDQLKYGQVYSYRVRAVSIRGGISPQSEEVRVVPLRSLAVPKGVAAQGGDSNAVLSWEPVTTRMDGSQYDGFVGYNVYRGTEKGRYDEAPLNKEPLRTYRYTDTTARNDRTYYYIVRAVDSPALPWKESLDSDGVSATPHDMTPPARPTGLTVVPGVNRAFLTWNENKERDLAGYYVYRSTRSGRDYERITSKLIMRSTFSDQAVKSGSTYYYMITAVDQAGNESAGSTEKKAYIEKLR